MSSHGEKDVPLGKVGILLGLRVKAPSLQTDEDFLWSARANRFQNRIRAVGGRLYLTNRRLIFRCSKVESLLGGKKWERPLGDLASAARGEDLMKKMVIESLNGEIERFRVPDRDETAMVIETAIKDARRRADGQ